MNLIETIKEANNMLLEYQTLANHIGETIATIVTKATNREIKWRVGTWDDYMDELKEIHIIYFSYKYSRDQIIENALFEEARKQGVSVTTKWANLKHVLYTTLPLRAIRNIRFDTDGYFISLSPEEIEKIKQDLVK